MRAVCIGDTKSRKRYVKLRIKGYNTHHSCSITCLLRLLFFLSKIFEIFKCYTDDNGTDKRDLVSKFNIFLRVIDRLKEKVIENDTRRIQPPNTNQRLYALHNII